MAYSKRAILPSSWTCRWCLVPAAIAWSLSPAEARDHRAAAYAIAAQPLPQALATLASAAGISIGSEEALPRLRTRAAHAATAEAALAQMLAGSGWRARRVGERAWRIERAPPPVATPSPPSEPGAEPLPIVVTATKRALPELTLPRALAVLAFEAPRNAGARIGTAEVGTEVEGLSATDLGPGRNRIFLRGIADSPFNGSSQSTVAMLFADSRLTYSAPDPDLRLVDVARVEILKGPQGSLYGTGALGGIYRIVPQPARTDRGEGAVELETQALADGGIGASLSGMANLPLVRERLGLRLVGYGGSTPGWIDTGTRRDSNSSHVAGGRAALGMDAANGWRIDLTGLAQFIATRDSQYVYAAARRDRPAQSPEPHDNDFRAALLRASGPIGAVRATFSTSLSWHEVDDTLDASVGASSFGLADPALFEDARHYRVWDSELRFDGRSGRLGWVAGISHVDAHAQEARDLVAATAGATLAVDRTATDTHDTGLFADLTLAISRGFSIEVGGRGYHGHATSRLVSATATADREIDRWAFSPSAALVWQPGGQGVAFLRYGSAFRQGGISRDGAGAVETYPGDTVRTLELGWRRQFAGGGRIDLGAHASWWLHMQSDMLLADGLIETREAGNARIVGGEATLAWPVTSHLQLHLGATVEHAVLVQSRLGNPIEDRRLPVVPEWTARIAVDRSFRFGAIPGSIGLGLRRLGPARLSFDRALDRPMGDLWESWAMVELAPGRTRVRLRIDNLANAAADTFSYGNPFRIRAPQYTPQRPLAASLAIARKF